MDLSAPRLVATLQPPFQQNELITTLNSHVACETETTIEGDAFRDVQIIVCVSGWGDSPSTVAIGGVVKPAESLSTGRVQNYVRARFLKIHCTLQLA